MTISHPTDTLLLDYAAGGLAEAMSVLVASHLALCPACRRAVDGLDAIGGALLADLPREQVAEGALDRMLARLDEMPAPIPPLPSFDGETLRVLPAPLRSYIGRNLAEVEWRRLVPGIEQYKLPVADGGELGATAELLRFRPGAKVPRHTHVGEEAILVLQGGFTDETGHYVRGDVAQGDETVTHRPVGDPGEPCICFAVLDEPVRLTGPLGWAQKLFRG
ncbi:MAG: anti-sigma factor [Alphaproteobacteria bacterium]|nr:anti-sigma factor [Alphaproteobacteria bacterium]